jgi:N-acetylglucosaminyldiphosphoundecaprenol N-acetyl-beta-D-mannosaminyltransferase
VRRQDGWPWGSGLSSLTKEQVIETLVSAAHRQEGHHVLTLNLDIYRQLVHLPAARVRLLESAYTLLLADGMPIVWGAALSGRPVVGRVTGADLLRPLTQTALTLGLHVHFTGGPTGAGDRAAAAVRDGRVSAGQLTTSSFQLAQRAEDVSYALAAESIASLKPNIVFCAYGFPKQDYLAVALRAVDPSITVIGCGAAFEFAAGMVKRAPRLMQRAGLEWLFRLGTEPRRLGRRYLMEDLPVLIPLLVAAWRARTRDAGPRLDS